MIPGLGKPRQDGGREVEVSLGSVESSRLALATQRETVLKIK